MKLRCIDCKTELTRELVELPDYDLISTAHGSEYLPVGYYVLQNKEFNGTTIQNIIVNLKDTVNVKRHTEKNRLNGCCGLDGLDGPNTVCMNQHIIGTEFSDCWMPHCFSFEPELVEWCD